MTLSESSTGLSGRKRLQYMGTAAAACIFGLLFAYIFSGSLDQRLDGEHYLVFHLIAEFASIVVSFAIFTIGWYGYKQRSDIRNLTLAITFFTVGLLDFIHAISFQGMPEFLSANSVGKSATYWIAARLIAAAGLLLVPFLPVKSPPAWLRPRLLVLASMPCTFLRVCGWQQPGPRGKG